MMKRSLFKKIFTVAAMTVLTMTGSAMTVSGMGSGTSADGGEYKYLAIGNSIAYHPQKHEMWLAHHGMAATSAEKDYVHLVTAYLENEHENVSVDILSISEWEIAEDRILKLEEYEDYFDADLDLVTVQLGENVFNMTTFLEDFAYLLRYIQNRCPNAEIIVVSDFWVLGDETQQRDAIKKEVVELCEVRYADISAIKGKEEYHSAIGETIYNEEGVGFTVEHMAVALHPNDLAMEYIANAIIEQINLSEEMELEAELEQNGDYDAEQILE